MRLKWKLILVHLEIVLVSVQDRCIFWPHVPLAQKSIWTHPMVLLGDEGQVEYLVFVRLDIVLILTQDRFAVCAEQAQKSFWMRPMELLGDVGQVESLFSLLGDNVGVGAR